MLVIRGNRSHTCDGPTRRELLRSGSIGLLGLSLPEFLAYKARPPPSSKAPKASAPPSPSSWSFLQGGPSHIDIWDPKPDAPLQHPRRLQAD